MCSERLLDKRVVWKPVSRGSSVGCRVKARGRGEQAVPPPWCPLPPARPGCLPGLEAVSCHLTSPEAWTHSQGTGARPDESVALDACPHPPPWVRPSDLPMASISGTGISEPSRCQAGPCPCVPVFQSGSSVGWVQTSPQYVVQHAGVQGLLWSWGSFHAAFCQPPAVCKGLGCAGEPRDGE